MSFFKKIKLGMFNLLVRSRIYNYAMKHIFPYIRFSSYYAQPSNPNFEDWGPLVKHGLRVLQAGHIILAIDEKNFAGKVIGQVTSDKYGQDHDLDGKADIFTHAAFCVSNSDDSFEIAEMTHTDFTMSCFSDVCYKATRVMILECPDFDKSYVLDMILKTPEFVDTPYDNAFNMGIDALACSELVYEYDFERRLKCNLEPLLGVKPYISPMGLYKAANLQIMWDSNTVD